MDKKINFKNIAQVFLYDLESWRELGAGRGEYGQLDTFYGKACEVSGRGGIIDGWGVVSMSGYGDGSYDVYVETDSEGKAVAARVVFIDDEYSSEEEYGI